MQSVFSEFYKRQLEIKQYILLLRDSQYLDYSFKV